MPLIYRLGCWVFSALLFASPTFAAEKLRILAWPGYADTDWVRLFEEQHDARVEVTFVGSDDELRRKFMAEQGKHFDLVAANTSEISHLVQQNLLQPLSLQQLPNRRLQLNQFRQLERIPGLTDAGQTYGIPYTYGEMGLIYSRKAFPVVPHSLAAMWDPRWQRRVVAYDGGTHNFSLARLVAGNEPFHMAPNEFAQAAAKLVDLRRNVLGFYRLPEESVDMFLRHDAVLLYANYGRQQLKLLQERGADVGYVLPDEGALAWLDCWALGRFAQNPELAHAWINFMLEPTVSRALTQRQGLANTLDPPEDTPAGAIMPLVWLEPVEDAPKREDLWLRLMSGESGSSLGRP